jgi:hypothetical protein
MKLFKKIIQYFTDKFDIPTYTPSTKNLRWEKHIRTLDPHAPSSVYHGYNRKTKQLIASIAYNSVTGNYKTFDGVIFDNLEEAKTYCDKLQ